MNQIFVIKPYLWNGVWVFDDPRVGLHREALIEGVPEIIQAATAQAGIANPERGFLALFSHEPFPDALEMEWVREEGNGNVYRWQGREGWLCPALFRYFRTAPAKLYFQVRPADQAWASFAEWYATKQAEIEGLLDLLPEGVRGSVERRARPWLEKFAREAWQAGFNVTRDESP